MSGHAARRFERLIGRTFSGIPLRDFSNHIDENSETICCTGYDPENQIHITIFKDGHINQKFADNKSVTTYSDGREEIILPNGQIEKNYCETNLFGLDL